MGRVTRSLVASVIGLLAACSGTPTAPTSSNVPRATPAQSLPTTTPSSLPTASATPTGVPPDVVFIPPSDSYVAGLIYTCGGAEFPIEVLDGPPTADHSFDPPAMQLNAVMDLRPIERWWLVERTDDSAEYIAEVAPGHYWSAYPTLQDGAWRLTSYGTCQMRAVAENGVVDTWWIPAARWPSPADETLRVTIRDECPDTVAARMLDPVIRYGADEILIIIPVRPQEPRDSRCRSGSDDEQLARVSVPLEEAVGNRALLDGASWPPRDAHTRSDKLLWCCG